MPSHERLGRVKWAPIGKVGFLLAAVAVALFLKGAPEPAAEAAATPTPRAMTLGVNLYRPATYNRQQVFTNLIAQSEWFASRGQGWSTFPAEQLDERGWIKWLKPGQTAPRPLIMPPAPFRSIVVRCRYEGKGQIDAGGLATVRERGVQSLLLDLSPTGKEDEAAWIELTRTDAADPVRAIDCRDVAQAADQRFHPDFLGMVKQFAFIRFLDWQRINDNAAVSWSGRTRPDSHGTWRNRQLYGCFLGRQAQRNKAQHLMFPTG